VKILVLSNLYPPHHAGTHDFRCQSVVEALRLRGHQLFILTSNHGLREEEVSPDTARRLRLNNAFGHPLVDRIFDLKALETLNHDALRESLAEFEPDLAYVSSLAGISKSLLFTLQRANCAIVYDVADGWLSDELKGDPWLRWWNAAQLPLADSMLRKSLEVSRQRDAWDEVAPTRHIREVTRLPQIFDGFHGGAEGRAPIMPFRFDQMFFCSQALRARALQAGFPVEQAAIIYPGIPAKAYLTDPRPLEQPVNRFVIFTRMHKESGIRTALHALQQVREKNPKAILNIYGQGDSGYISQQRSFVVQQGLPVEFRSVSDPLRDMPGVYRQHDAFLRTTEWDEPYDTLHLEAMAAGLPVIGTNVGGAAETLQHGVNAVTYAPGDAAGLAQAMLWLNQEPAARVQLAKAGQQDAVANYSDSVVIGRIEQFLTEALAVHQSAVGLG
jgi:glycogen synthase